MKNKFLELFSWVGAMITLTVIMWMPHIILLRMSKPLETERVTFTTIEKTKQQLLLDQLKNAKGDSVLIKKEELVNDVAHITLYHYARWTELGEVQYWVEVVE